MYGSIIKNAWHLASTYMMLDRSRRTMLEKISRPATKVSLQEQQTGPGASLEYLPLPHPLALFT